jgi:N-acetylmuramoyl-L-alanine amidase
MTVGGAANEKFNTNEYKIAKPICEMIANSLRDKLKPNYEVVLIDAGTIKKYGAYKVNSIDSNTPELAVELHFNSFVGEAKKSPSHPLVIYDATKEKEKVYAQKIIDELDALYADKKWTKGKIVGIPCEGYDMERYWLIHNTNSTTMIIEAFFMKNDEQVEWITTDPNAQKQLAKSLTDGILKCVLEM